ncbi:MAG: DUF4124 domain-containing protein [Gammaproteobacteria bacterium]
MKVLVSVVLILAAAAAYIYLNPEEIRPWLQGTPVEQMLPGTPLEQSPAETTLYKWRDATGQWQVSDKPPEGGVKYEVLRYRSDVNVIPAVPEKEKK